MKAKTFIIASALVLLASNGLVAQTIEPLRFVQLCDTQLGMGGYEQDLDAFKKAVQDINALNPDLVLLCGDLVSNGAVDKEWEDFNAIRKGFTVPSYCLPGNHDVGKAATAESIARFQEKVGPDYQVVKVKGVHFILTNTTLWKSPLADYSEKHDAWFKAALEEAKQSKCQIIMAGHYPPMLKRVREKEAYFNLPKDKRQEVLDLAKAYGVRAILAGHTHKNIITDYEGIPIVASATSSKNFDGAFRGFRLWTLGADAKLSHEYIPIKDAPPNPEK